ncbi:hypothetical protein ACMAY7_12680 [Rhodobacteraceae bacterium nBUS_24]
MRKIVLFCVALGLTGCEPTIPESGLEVLPPKLADTTAAGIAVVADTINVLEDTVALVDRKPAEVEETSLPNSKSIELSDENDFEAVSNRQTIESDAERLAINRMQYVLIEPTELPVRPGTDIPNVVEYALLTSNPVGAPLYPRSGLVSENSHLYRCGQYTSSTEAQEVFLKRGGPKRDWLGLDPDGDGFACTWDPLPFRLALTEG